jgi:predicted deacetylase
MRKLLVSLHDVTPVLENRSRRMVDIIMETTGVDFTMLVVPDYHSSGRLDKFPGFCSWLREMDSMGVEIAQHGLTHMGQTPRGSLAGRMLTHGEGEFLTTDRTRSEEFIKTGFTILSDATGRKPSGFTAPAWLYSRGTREALKTFPFDWVEHRSFVDYSHVGRRPGPVIVFASRTPWKRLCSRIWAGAGPVFFRPAGTLRTALHAKDFPGLAGSAKRTLLLAKRGRVCSVCGQGVAD